jgi:hypothetical protein
MQYGFYDLLSMRTIGLSSLATWCLTCSLVFLSLLLLLLLWSFYFQAAISVPRRIESYFLFDLVLRIVLAIITIIIILRTSFFSRRWSDKRWDIDFCWVITLKISRNILLFDCLKHARLMIVVSWRFAQASSKQLSIVEWLGCRNRFFFQESI